MKNYLPCCGSVAIVCVGANYTFGYDWAPGTESLFRIESRDLSGAFGINNTYYVGLKLMAYARAQSFKDYTLRVKLEQPRFVITISEISSSPGQKNIKNGGLKSNVSGVLLQGIFFRPFLEETMLVHLKRGLVKSFFVSQDEPATVTNIKKSILAQLQLDASGSLELMMEQPVSLPLPIPYKLKQENSLVYTYPENVSLKQQLSSEMVQTMEKIKTYNNIHNWTQQGL